MTRTSKIIAATSALTLVVALGAGSTTQAAAGHGQTNLKCVVINHDVQSDIELGNATGKVIAKGTVLHWAVANPNVSGTYALHQDLTSGKYTAAFRPEPNIGPAAGQCTAWY
jgi:hypothetical protein